MARISIFKGREARLNKAIFSILAQQGPLTIYDVWRKLRNQRDFAYIRYHIVNRRVRALQEQGYIEEIGKRRTRTGFIASLYQLTIRAYLSVVLENIDLNGLIAKASQEDILSALGVLASHLF